MKIHQDLFNIFQILPAGTLRKNFNFTKQYLH